MKVVIRQASGAERAAALLRRMPRPCAEGAVLSEGLSSTPTAELPVGVRAEQRQRGLLWRAHFLECARCYDVWARESLENGAVVLSPTRPPEGPF